MRKHLVKFKMDGVRKQRTVEAESIYEAERIVRKENKVTENSMRIEILTIKAGRTEYQVFGTTLG